MLIESNKSLKDYNTFGIDCKAKYYVSVTTSAELIEILSDSINSIRGTSSSWKCSLIDSKSPPSFLLHLSQTDSGPNELIDSNCFSSFDSFYSRFCYI